MNYLLHIHCPKKYVNQEQPFPRVYKNLQQTIFSKSGHTFVDKVKMHHVHNEYIPRKDFQLAYRNVIAKNNYQSQNKCNTLLIWSCENILFLWNRNLFEKINLKSPEIFRTTWPYRRQGPSESDFLKYFQAGQRGFYVCLKLDGFEPSSVPMPLGSCALS
jgi:hypothetical protein